VSGYVFASQSAVVGIIRVLSFLLAATREVWKAKKHATLRMRNLSTLLKRGMSLQFCVTNPVIRDAEGNLVWMEVRFGQSIELPGAKIQRPRLSDILERN
jgi:hypothetical protein